VQEKRPKSDEKVKIVRETATKNVNEMQKICICQKKVVILRAIWNAFIKNFIYE
jgi:hypothetical protein